ncbi:hypothetical protein GBAR_LOCUS4145 [Geodia barretti]|uniref:Pyridoxamine 5'-phosphate oxidase putative domain-containing protein n=1 Tax=Geodia barretti TaxID=519541 RepID=A0AA35R7M4_GEOBA|nr:hypothetical protein GBAR_LOCUS4145 [Geodia barretti]
MTATREPVVGDSQFNGQFGPPSERAVKKLKGHLTPWVQEFVSNAPFVVMASADADGRCDASPKGGKPGFVKSYQNIETSPYVGLIFFIPGKSTTQSASNGRASVVSKAELDQQNIELALYETDDNSRHLQGLLIEVEESYSHCPRALKFSKLWDAEEVASNRANPPISERTDENYWAHEAGA